MMRVAAAIVLACAFCGVLIADTARPLHDSHIRPMHPRAFQAFEDGLLGSATFRRLVDAIECSDVFVYVVTTPHLPPALGASIRFMGAAPGARYVQISLSIWESRHTLVSLLGHELRHALEVAADPTITSAARFHRFYARMGVRSGNGHMYDSEAAREAGVRVREELTAEAARVRQVSDTCGA